MLAYHNDTALKETVLAEMAHHREADNLLQKYGYWKEGKGCAVGCLIKSANHEEYETRFGIPQMLARLEDAIFEGLPKEDAKEWPERFLNAIAPGADLSLVGWKFLYWNLTENLVLKDSDNAKVQKVIIQCREAINQCGEAICPLTKGEKMHESAAWSAAESAAWSAESAESAAWSAESAESAAWSAESAESAAWSAESAAWSAVRSAAESAAWSAASAVRSAESAAESAARSAWSAWSAAWSAESAAWLKMADKLIDLIQEAA